MINIIPKSDAARLLSLSSGKSISWINGIPNKSYGLYFNKQQLFIAVKLALGQPISSTPKTCNFCLKNMDLYGHHALQCGSGNDRHSKHNIIRDLIYLEASKGMMILFFLL